LVILVLERLTRYRGGMTIRKKRAGNMQKKRGKNGAGGRLLYFLDLSTSYSASTGAMVFVDMDRRTSVVSLRQ
jgi:hypothetical protein